MTPTTAPQPAQYIHRRELQRALGVCSDTLRRWMRSGKVPAPDIAITRENLQWRRETLHAAGIKV